MQIIEKTCFLIKGYNKFATYLGSNQIIFAYFNLFTFSISLFMN